MYLLSDAKVTEKAQYLWYFCELAIISVKLIKHNFHIKKIQW